MEQTYGNQNNHMAMQSNFYVGLPTCSYSSTWSYSENSVMMNTMYPPGYRFVPTDEELIIDYLMKKIRNTVLPDNMIRDVNIYNHHPKQLYKNYKIEGENIMYFFSPRDRKYPKGSRPSRSTGSGYWKATGADTPIGNKKDPIGYRKALVFYEGIPKQSTKTNWIMHEYRINQKSAPSTCRAPHNMRLDDCVLCKIYNNMPKIKNQPPTDGELPNLVPQPESNQDLPLLNGSHPPPMNNTNISTMCICNGHTNGYGCGDHKYSQGLALLADDGKLEIGNLQMTGKQGFPSKSAQMTQFEVPNLPDFDFSFIATEEDYIFVDSILNHPTPPDSVPGDKAQHVP